LFSFPIKKNTAFTPFYYIFFEGYIMITLLIAMIRSLTNSTILLTKGKNITRRASRINEDGEIFSSCLKDILSRISHENIDAKLVLGSIIIIFTIFFIYGMQFPLYPLHLRSSLCTNTHHIHTPFVKRCTLEKRGIHIFFIFNKDALPYCHHYMMLCQCLEAT
jgi:hypothetical protein